MAQPDDQALAETDDAQAGERVPERAVSSAAEVNETAADSAAPDTTADDSTRQDGAKPASPAADSESRESALAMTGEVTVVPGIARYHRSQCILIRFLGEGDLEKMTRAAAEEAKFIACRACQPDKELADL